ncbi:KGG domain-containing protein [Sorangium sp. So ce388]|uniref:KGG domain-containing protein n=1 Tax=Sorangium sp. So ce388 TaxID=3133309 RepID=UPI003F5BA59D
MEQQSQTKKPRGFAAMTPEQHRALASRGGKAAQATGRAHRWDVREAGDAGRKGGTTLASRPGHMESIGQLGGKKISADRDHMREIGRKGGRTIAARPGHMAEIGRAGGKASRRRRAGN